MTAPSRRPTAAPFGRLLVSELELALARPRTAVALGALALVPVLATIGLLSEDAHALGVLLVSNSELAAFSLAMPVVLVAADGFAAERARGTLDGLRLAPVGPLRLLALKGAAVAVTAALAAVTVSVVAAVAGLLVLGAGPYGAGATVSRALLTSLWMTGQLAGLGSVLLALSAFVRRPAVVVATGLAVTTVAPLVGVLWETAAPALPTGHWHETLTAMTAVPADLGPLGATTLRAVGLAVAGAGVTGYLLTRRDG